MLTILGRTTSANVQKLMWLCHECDIPFLRKDVDTSSLPYRDLNPNRKVPTLVDDDFVIWESNAILQYLCAKHALDDWYPTDPKRGARVRQWMDWSSTEFYRAAEPVWIGMIRMPGSFSAEAIEAGRKVWLQKLKLLDRHLAHSAYVAGDTITVADLPLAIMVYRWYGLPIAHEDLLNVKRWYELIAARPAFQDNVVAFGIH